MLGQTNFQARTRGFSRFDEDELVLVADDHFALDTRHVRGDVFSPMSSDIFERPRPQNSPALR